MVGVGLNVRDEPRAHRRALGADQRRGASPDARCRREDVLGAVLRGLGVWFARWYRDGDAPVVAAFARHDALVGRPVGVAVGDATLTGVADGLDAERRAAARDARRLRSRR